MAYEEQTGLRTHAQQQEAILVGRVFFVEELNRKLVLEDRPCLFERDTMLDEVCRCFSSVPLESDHQASVRNGKAKSSTPGFRLDDCRLVAA